MLLHDLGEIPVEFSWTALQASNQSVRGLRDLLPNWDFP
jgi:hypothetical protein